MSFVILYGGMVILSSVIYCSGNVTYHIAFLGRIQATSVVDIGRLMIQGATPVPNNPVTDEFLCEWTSTSVSAFTYVRPSNNCAGLVPSGTGLSSSGIKVTLAADNILHVFQNDASGADSDGFLAIPDDHIGNEYFVITYCALGGFCQFAVAGTVDGTTVNIVFPPGSSTNGVTCNGDQLPDSAPPGQPVSFTLNEFSVLHFESQSDLSGTYISSDHNVSVFVGARNMPNVNGIESFLIEQIPPVNKWGTEFVVVPNELNKAGDVIKILTKEDDTLIHIQRFSRLRIKNKGESTVHRVDWKMPSRIMTSKPVLIVQVMSVNLYNDTTAVTGQPAMVIVPHVQQWNDRTVTTNCFLKGNSVVTVTTDISASTGIAWIPQVSTSPWESVDGTDYTVKAVSTLPTLGEVIQHGDKRVSYGYCGGIAAFLLDANWEWENQECEVTVPIPGDGVDNDCNGFADEIECTEDDIATYFTSTQDPGTGAVEFKRIYINGRRALTFTVKSCDIAVVILQSSTQPELYLTIYIGSKAVILQSNLPNVQNSVQETVTADCLTNRTYKIQWYTENDNTRHNFTNDDGSVVGLLEVSGQTLDYDIMVLSSFVGTTHFRVDLPEKDCGKIISNKADRFGKSFVVYVKEGTVWIFVTNKNTHSVQITLNGENPEDIRPETTIRIADAYEHEYMVLIEASAEVSVCVWPKISTGPAFITTILPTDVLGPNYHLYLESSLTGPTDEICTVFSIEGEATTNIGVQPETNTKHIITKEIYDGLQYNGMLTADRPVAVFCGARDSMAQMPPRESLGTQHYIPKIDLSRLNVVATIRLVAAEDSTVVIIKGNYDQLDTVNLTGDIYSRSYETNMLYNISATKPIQVFLEFRTADPTKWASLIAIPPVEQYLNEHVFPGFGDVTITDRFTTAVSADGHSVAVVSSTGSTPVVQRLNYASPTFTLTFLEINVIRWVVVPSDVKYDSINQNCTKTQGTPGDGEDNDCDGLIDEERCSDNLDPGHIDVDIDGNLNEDCAADTSVSSSAISLALGSEMGTCVNSNGAVEGNENQNAETESESDSDKIIIENGAQAGYTCCADAPNVETVTGSEATYEHLESSSGTILTSSVTTSAPDSTAAPEETCVTDCVCPCGWVHPPKNYTSEELQAKVTEIQEKLIISKKSLSSVIRKKISVQDRRPEATALGYVGVAFLVTMLGTVVLLDLTAIARDVRMMMSNLREVFQP